MVAAEDYDTGILLPGCAATGLVTRLVDAPGSLPMAISTLITNVSARFREGIISY